MAKKLHAFQMRGIRKILNKAPTYIDRKNTNAKLLEEASMIAFPSRDDRRQILLFSEAIMSYTSLFKFRCIKTGIVSAQQCH